MTVNVLDLQKGKLPQVCNILSASKLVCTVVAVNDAGFSPAVQKYGYTLLKGKRQILSRNCGK